LRQGNSRFAVGEKHRAARKTLLPSESTQKSVKVPITQHLTSRVAHFLLLISSSTASSEADPHSSIVLDAEMKTNHPQVTRSLQTKCSSRDARPGVGSRGEFKFQVPRVIYHRAGWIIPLPLLGLHSVNVVIMPLDSETTSSERMNPNWDKKGAGRVDGLSAILCSH
jgi:hypothetical protein